MFNSVTSGVFTFGPTEPSWKRSIVITQHVARLRDELIELSQCHLDASNHHQMMSLITDESADVLHFILAIGMETGIPYTLMMDHIAARSSATFVQDLGNVDSYELLVRSTYDYCTASVDHESNSYQLARLQNTAIRAVLGYAAHFAVPSQVVISWLRSKVSLRNKFGEDKHTEKLIRAISIQSHFPEVVRWSF